MNIDTNKSAMRGYIMIFIAGVLWGTTGFFVTKMTNLGAPAYLTAFTGHFFTLLPLLLFIILTKGVHALKISKRTLIFAIIMGVVTKGFFKLAYDSAIAIVGVSMAAVLLYTGPIFVAIMSVLILKEKLYLNNYIALFLNIIGVFLMVSGGNLSSLNISLLGLGLGILAAFLNASNTIVGKISSLDDVDPIVMTFYILIFSSITLGLVAQPWEGENLAFLKNGEFLFWAIINAITTGGVANLLYLWGLAYPIDVSKAPIFSSVEVIVSTLLGVFVFDESINNIGIIGIAIMLASIVIMNLDYTSLVGKDRIKEKTSKEEPTSHRTSC